MDTSSLKIAVLDLYDNHPNQGMRCIREIIQDANQESRHGFSFEFDEFETRYKAEIPGTDYDLYISTGGPGSPYDGTGKEWELRYFHLVDSLWNHNRRTNGNKKYVFFICHSFQMMCRFFGLTDVVKRYKPAFGVFPVHNSLEGRHDVLYQGLQDPFMAADFRDWQSIGPNIARWMELNATLLSLEKIRDHIPLERAAMAIRLSDEMVGTQYHPEADPASMHYHFSRPDLAARITDKHGEDKYLQMMQHLDDPDKLQLTRNTVLFNFLFDSARKLRPELVSG